MAERRKVILINPKFQWSVVRFAAVLNIAALAVVYGAHMVFYNYFNGVAEKAGLPKDHLFFSFLDNQHQYLNYLFIAILVLVTLIILIGGIYLSHKVAGPLYRLNKHLESCREKSEISDIKFRKGDYFPEIELNFNKLSDSLNQK